MESTQGVAWPCSTAPPAGPEISVAAARDNHAERCDRLADYGRDGRVVLRFRQMRRNRDVNETPSAAPDAR